MIDNMPYVLAEASVMRIPLLIYDVGGVTEMIDPKLHADVICGTPKVTLRPNCPSSMEFHSEKGYFAGHTATVCGQHWGALDITMVASNGISCVYARFNNG
jgi:hypothetical protein